MVAPEATAALQHYSVTAWGAEHLGQPEEFAVSTKTVARFGKWVALPLVELVGEIVEKKMGSSVAAGQQAAAAAAAVTGDIFAVEKVGD